MIIIVFVYSILDIVRKYTAVLTTAISGPDTLAVEMWSAGLISDDVKDDVLFTQPMSDLHKINKLMKQLHRSCSTSADGFSILSSFCAILKKHPDTAVESVLKNIEDDTNSY